MQCGGVGPHIVVGNAAIPANKIGWVGQAAVRLMDGTLKIISQNRPIYFFFALVPAGVQHFLFKSMVRLHAWAGMGLANENIHKVYMTFPVGIQFSQRLDRAVSDRSTYRTEMEYNWFVTQVTQAKRTTISSR